MFNQDFLNILNTHTKVDLKDEFFDKLQYNRRQPEKIMKPEATEKHYSTEVARKTHLTPDVPYTLRQAHMKVIPNSSLSPIKLEEEQRKEMLGRENGFYYKKKLYYPNFVYHDDNIIKWQKEKASKAPHTNLENRKMSYRRPQATENPTMTIKNIMKQRKLMLRNQMM